MVEAQRRMWPVWAAVMAVAGCASDEADPVHGPVAGSAVPQATVSAMVGRWCPPFARVGQWDFDATGGRGVFEVDGRTLSATWAIDAHEIVVERSLDGVVFETQRWELGDAARLEARALTTPTVLSADDEALVARTPLDDHQAFGRDDDWRRALVVDGAECDALPSAYGHGYPASEGWYVPGSRAADAAADPASGVAWYGHGGDEAGAPFSAARSQSIAITYDSAERMIEERLDRGAASGGPHDILRTRSFAEDGQLVADRMERWSPTPKEDVVRVLTFAREGSDFVRRELRDTWDQALEARWIPVPTR